jgi:DNA-binding MarR family transcriptional regulator
MSSGDDRTSEEATIVRAAMRLARRLRQSAPSAELTGGGLGLLVTLYQGGPMSAAALARCEGLQPQSLSRLLARMERDGLIERKADVVDRRRGVIAVTRRGLEALNGAMSQRRRWLSAVMTDRLNDQERSVLLQAAELMLRIAS